MPYCDGGTGTEFANQNRWCQAGAAAPSKESPDQSTATFLLTGTCMYRGHVHTAERVSDLVPKEVKECVHAQLGRTSRGHLYLSWIRSNDHENARDTPMRRNRTTNRERTGSTVQVWSYNCESCFVPGRMAGAVPAGDTIDHGNALDASSTKDWRDSFFGQGEADPVNGWRTISPLSHGGKALMRCIWRQILPKVAPKISEAQFGRVPGKGTREAVLVATEIIARFHKATKGPRKSRNPPMYLAAVLFDLEKAFDKVDRTPAFAALSAKARWQDWTRTSRRCMTAPTTKSGTATGRSRDRSGSRKGCVSARWRAR